MQNQTQQAREALESKVQEERVQWELELRESREQAEQQRQQTREKLGAVQEELRQKEAAVAELEGSLRQKQVIPSVVCVVMRFGVGAVSNAPPTLWNCLPVPLRKRGVQRRFSRKPVGLSVV